MRFKTARKRHTSKVFSHLNSSRKYRKCLQFEERHQTITHLKKTYPRIARSEERDIGILRYPERGTVILQFPERLTRILHLKKKREALSISKKKATSKIIRKKHTL